jgi:hypothetical protein
MNNNEELMSRIQGIVDMTKTNGWELYQAMLGAVEKTAEHHLMTAPQPHEVYAFRELLKVIRQLKTWPEREVTATREAIELSLAKEAEK